jgi:hypothetical protein
MCSSPRTQVHEKAKVRFPSREFTPKKRFFCKVQIFQPITFGFILQEKHQYAKNASVTSKNFLARCWWKAFAILLLSGRRYSLQLEALEEFAKEA